MSILTVNLVVPSSGDGPIVDISALIGQKTVTLTGLFAGSYTLLVSDDGTSFVPAAFFNSGGVEGIEQTISGAFQFAKVRSNAIAHGSVSMKVTGVARAGENHFATLATFPPGSGGSGPIIDTGILFPPSGLETDIALLCSGIFTGNIVVMGSNDGVKWNPVGEFEAAPSQHSLLGLPQSLEFSPLPTQDLTRYLQVVADAVIMGTAIVSIGGRIPIQASGGGGGIPSIEEEAARSTTLNPPVNGEILYEWTVNFDSEPVGKQIGTSISYILKSTANGGMIWLYVGATNPGSTAGGTIVYTAGSAVTAEFFVKSGFSFANLGGIQLVQLVGLMNQPTTDVETIRSVGIVW
jgi:hypothetical protein